MNVLLAEADVPYEQLAEMADVNPEFPRTDVAILIGANDVANPDARTNPQSGLWGMPVLNADEARSITPAVSQSAAAARCVKSGRARR